MKRSLYLSISNATVGDILPSLKGGASQATHGITSPTLALEGTVRARSRIT